MDADELQVPYPFTWWSGEPASFEGYQGVCFVYPWYGWGLHHGNLQCLPVSNGNINPVVVVEGRQSEL